MYTASTEKFVEPKIVVSHFHLREGDVVADFGAGSGHYMKPLSEAVGRSGRVYVCEIQKNLVDAIGIRAREERLTNIHPLWCDLETAGGTKLGESVLDAGLLSNTLFQIVHKDVALTEMARVIRKGGKLLVIDWTESFGGLGPHADHVVSEDDAKRLLERAGFTFERSFPAGSHHYGLACRRQ